MYKYMETRHTQGKENNQIYLGQDGCSNPPNPTNPNAQDQFVDAMQGSTNQAEGPTIPN